MNVAGMINDRLNAPFTGPLLSDMKATENGVTVDQDLLTAKDIQDMETILRTGMVGYAYVYPIGGEPPQTYVFSMTPENMGNFIGKYGANCHKIVMTDRLDMLILDTYYCLIDQCRDKQLLRDVMQHLIPIQFRQAETKEFPMVSYETYDRYDKALEEVRTSMTPEDLKQVMPLSEPMEQADV